MSDDDLTLETLLSVRQELDPAIDELLLKQCYQIQKRFQFSEDRSASQTEMERLIDAHVKNILDDLQS